MKSKIKSSEQLSKTINSIVCGDKPTDEFLSELLRLGAQRILQEATEAEVDEFLGRGWYERNSEDAPHRGYRNGYTPVTYKTSQGPLKLQRPCIRDNEEPFESRILARLDGLEERLVTLATETYVRGLSTRDIEQTLTISDGVAL